MGLGIFGDQSKGYKNYANELDALGEKYNPLIERGNQAGDRLWGEYGKGLDSPNWLQDFLAGKFEMSPYQQNLLDLMTERMNYNNANTGMLGSGQANAALQDQLLKMSGQFMNDYITNGMGVYNKALGGYEGFNTAGQNALNAQVGLGQEAAAGRLQGARSKQGALSNMVGSIGGAIGGVFGGPIGAAIGGGLGKGISGGGSTYNAGRV